MYRKTMFKGTKAPNKFKRAAGKTILRAFKRAKVRRLYRAARPARIRANFIRANPQLYMGRHTLPSQQGRARTRNYRYIGKSQYGYANRRY